MIFLVIANLADDKNEHMTDVDALANVASLYNSQNMKVTNLEVTGNLTVGGATKTGSLVTPVIAPVEVSKSTGTLSIWGAQINAPSSSFIGVQIPVGDLAVAGKATIGGDITATGSVTSTKNAVIGGLNIGKTVDTDGWEHAIAVNNPDNIDAETGKIKHNKGWSYHNNGDHYTKGLLNLSDSGINMSGIGNKTGLHADGNNLVWRGYNLLWGAPNSN